MSERSANSKNATVIGDSIVISGDVSGKEDITVNGTVEGEINFRENDITVGESGQINANVTARNISVKGEVKGELRATEQVSIKPTGRVTGDIRAPRVVLDDGCQFKGSVDMDEKHAAEPRGSKLQLAGNKAHPLKGKKPAKA